MIIQTQQKTPPTAKVENIFIQFIPFSGFRWFQLTLLKIHSSLIHFSGNSSERILDDSNADDDSGSEPPLSRKQSKTNVQRQALSTDSVNKSCKYIKNFLNNECSSNRRQNNFIHIKINFQLLGAEIVRTNNPGEPRK